MASEIPSRKESLSRSKKKMKKKLMEEEKVNREQEIDALHLPPRSSTHQAGERKKKTRADRKKKKERSFQFPLVRILLFLFLLLVAVFLTYPLWIDKLI